MIAYLITFTFVLTMSGLIQKYKGQKIVKWLLGLLIVGMSLFIGFRYGVGTDYASYYSGYYHYSRMSWEELIKVGDPALRIIAKLCSYFIDSPITMFTIAALIFCSLFVTSIYEYSEDFVFAMFLFICCGTFLEAFNGVRQATAMSIIFFGFRYVKGKKFFKYLITILIATLFHSTAILMISLYFVFNMKVKVFNVLLIAVVSIILASSYEWIFSLVESITGKKVNFEYEYYTTQVNVFRVAVACAPCALMLFLGKQKVQKNSIYCSMLIFNAALMVITSASAFLARIGMYSTAFIPLALTCVKNEINFDKQTRAIFNFIVRALYFAYFIVSILETGNLYPYKLFF